LQRTLSLWFCGIAALSCLAVGSLTYYLRAQGIRDFLLSELATVRDDKIADIRHWFRERRQAVQIWGDNPGIVRLVEQHVTGQPIEDRELRQQQLDSLRQAYNCHAIGIFDARTGVSILASSGPYSHDVLDPDILRLVLEARGVIHTDVRICPTHQVPTVVFAGPVRPIDAEGKIPAVIAFHMDLEQFFYPEVLKTSLFGEHGEIVLVNRDGVAQSPLRHVENAEGRHTLSTEAARLAAVGQTGGVVSEDYYGNRVVAAHGFIPEAGWGIVTLKDYQEATRVTREMTRQVVFTSLGVLVLSSLLALFVSARIAGPAQNIAAVTDSIRQGQLDLRAKLRGPQEIRTVAHNFNSMMDQLARQLWAGEHLGKIFAAAGAHNRVLNLLDAVLPKIMETTRSQLSVFYLANADGNSFRCMAVNGSPLDGVAEELHISPPDHLLAQAARDGKVQVYGELSDRHELRIVTQSGLACPAALMSIPLIHSGKPIAIVGLASLYEYRPEDLDIARTLSLSLGQSVAAALANEKNIQISEELRLNNEELTRANEELQAQTEELQQQTEELQQQSEELAQQRAAVEEADRLKSQFLSNMSHELRTPLNSILALSQLMLSRGTGVNREKEAEYLAIIERNGRHLLNLINDILDLSKIEAGRIDLLPAPFRPEHVVQRALEVTRPLAEAKGLEVRFEADPVPELVTDEDKVHQILLNLLSNAVKFTDQGSITVRVGVEDGQMLFSVQDTGIGISEADLPNIFDEFRQVDGSTTRRHEGTGLGLAIGQKLAHLLGGEIRVETAPGQGSTFTLALPLRPSQAPPTTLSSVPSRPHAASRTRTILVVDDDPSVRNLLRTYLTESGYEVIVASNGREAIRLARENKLYAITLDVLMPDLDGWEVIHELKADAKTASIPILVISVTEDRATALALGASGFLLKPVDRNILLAELDRIARSRPLQHILVVDDDANTREQLELMLGQKYPRITLAAGGEEALKLVRESRPDAMILDLMMPGIDGFSVLERLRSDPLTSDLPVLILTAKDLDADERRRLQRAVSRIVTKGAMDRSQLLVELDRALLSLQPPSASSSPHSALVLVVDDDEIASIQISSALEDAGYKTAVARSGAEALTRARQEVPDAVVLDLMMPGMDGFEVLHKLRSMPETAELPVLILTAKELTAAERARLADNRIRQLIQKGSVDRDQLVQVVAEMINRPRVTDPPVAAHGVRARPDGNGDAVPRDTDGEGVILVVEDNPDNLFTIAAVLDDMGRKHVHAADGEQAVRMVRQIKPALVLMDMQLPVLSGMDAVQRIKSDPELAGIPVVALTAKAMRGDREKLLAAGCDDYLAKPLDRDALARLLAKWSA